MKRSLFLSLLISALILTGCQASAPTTSPKDTTEASASENTQVQEKIFTMSGVNFAFLMDGEENPTITVKKGDTVRIEFTSDDGFHDWVVDEFNAATEQVRPGSPTSVTFVADEAGSFEYYCSVGSHRENGMKGMLVVEE